MKHYFKSSLLFLVAAAMTIVSCKPDEPTKPKGTSISASPAELTFSAKSAASQQITITSDGDWLATAPEWISIDPLSGNGNATVTVTAKDNADASGAMQGPRSGKVVFSLLDDQSINASVSVNQEGDNSLDTRHTYVKVDKVTSGKAYLVVALAPNQDNSLVIPVLFGDTGTYGYPKSTKVEANEDGSITLEDETSGLVFTEAEGGYTIQMYNSRYIWKQDGYKTWSCSLLGEMPAEPYVWAVAPRGDGTFEITLNGGIMSYGTENYTTFSAYPEPDDYTVYPFLYEDTKDVVLNTDYISVNPKTQTVAATATEAEFAVSSNLAWTVAKTEGDWIKNFAESGNGDGKITVQFDANESETERTAKFTVTSADGAIKTEFTLVQSGVVSSFDSIADVQKSTDTEKTFNVKGTVAGVYARGCLITDGTGYILYYKNAAVDYVIGDELTISGVISVYGGFNQFTNAALVEKVGHKDDFAHPEAVAFDNAAFQAWYDAEAKEVKYVSFEGVLAVDGSYYNVTVEDGSNLIARMQYATIENAADINGHKIAVKGYTIGTSKDAPIVNVMMTDIEDKGAVLTETDHGATTIADFIAAPVSSMDWYQLTGKITNIDNAKYNDFYMEDETGSVYVYGLYKEKGAERIFNYVDSLGLAAGDIITLKALRSEYSGTVQAGSAYYISHEKGTEPQPELNTYTSCGAVNEAILAGETSFIFDPEDFVEVTYFKGSYVYVQDATGGALLYGTGLESAGVYIGLRFKGALTCSAKVFNGLPEITAVTDGLSTITKDYNAQYPCINITLAELVNNYDKYLNCKVKVDGVTVKDGWQGTKDRNGVIQVGDVELKVYCQDTQDSFEVKTGCEGNIVGWPAYYKTTKQISFWSHPEADKAFFTVTKEAEEGGEGGDETIYTNCGELNAAIIALQSGEKLNFKANFTTDAEITLMASDNKSIYVQDATGALLLYNADLYTALKAQGAQAGISLTGEFSGVAEQFNFLPEVTSLDITKATIKQTWGFPCKNLTIAQLVADFDKYVNCKIKISDVEVSDGWNKSDKNGSIKQGDDTLPVYVKNANITDDIITGSKGAYVGYAAYTKKDGNPVKQMTYWEDGKFIATYVPTVVEVYINEISTKDKKIEIYNAGNADVDIAGFSLVRNAAVSDYNESKDKWVVPAGMGKIPAKGFVVYKVKQDDAANGPRFGLSGDKGFILELRNAAGEKIDEIVNRPVDEEKAIVVIADSETYGRKTDGAAEWVLFSEGTIGASNAGGTIKKDPAPEGVLSLDNDAIKDAHSEAWNYTSGEKSITAADGSVWVAFNTYANKNQVTIQMNKGRNSYVLTPMIEEGKTIKKLTVVFNSSSDGTGTNPVTKTLDIFDGDTEVLTEIKGDDLTAGIEISGSHRQLKIAPNETGGGAFYIVSAQIEFE